MDTMAVAILVFDEVEVLDFSCPFEVFSRTRTVSGTESRRSDESAPFTVFTVAKSRDPITATGGLRLIPHYGFSDAPDIDLSSDNSSIQARRLLENKIDLESARP